MAAQIDSWEARIMAEAAAYRAANPDPQFAEVDAHLDTKWNAVQGQPTRPVTEVADEPAPARRPSTGASNYGASNPYAATERQISFIQTLCNERALNPADYRPRDKKHASQIIDQLKAMPRGGAVTQAPIAKPAPRPATERQVEFVTDLWNTRQHVMGEQVPDDMSFEDASALIEFLLTQPKVSKVADHGIRAGRYATRDEDGVVHFYVIGRTGKIEIQAGPARHPYTGRGLNAHLEAIKADPKTAAALYGQELGHCGRCGLELTDETSRSLGLGPVCATKDEW